MRAPLLITLFGLLGCTPEKAEDAAPAEDSGADTALGEAGASYPEDTGAEGVAAFLADLRYRGGLWSPESAAPREETSPSSPHDRVQVWLNDVVRTSQDAGNGEFEGTAHFTGSMAAKEMVDDDDAVVGIAVMLKLSGDADQWVYYCDGPEGRCGVEGPTTPYYGIEWEAECHYCHGGLIFNGLL